MAEKRMAFQPDRPIKIELSITAEQPQLLEGLDLWLRLGLLTDRQVRQISRSHLVCSLPQLSDAAVASAPQRVDRAQEVTSQSGVAVDAYPSGELRGNRGQLVPQLLSSLMAEISVVWLLLLGVFMVVVSSAVLAASQWQNFSPEGQYAILWGYTLAFWLAALWTGQRPNLRLTGRMLQVATLLIIPVNFWMIDGFQLWKTSLGLGLAMIAGLSLSAITALLLRSSSRLMVINSLGLSWLHWGWAIPGLALIATYIGTIGTAVLQGRREEAESHTSPEDIETGRIALAFATLLLVGRALLGAGVPLQQLGLAFGICGWLLSWLSRSTRRPLWGSIGVGLLVLGWLVAVTVDPPWQAILVSGLGLWLLGDRLNRLRRVQDLVALFLIGLQAYSLLWRLLPVPLQSQVIVTATQFAGADLRPWQLVGIGLFPCVIAMVLLAFYLRRQQQSQLAVTAEWLVLALGIGLATVSGFNPLVRSLYLLLATLTLAGVLLKRSTPGAWLTYLTHLSGLLTLFSWINWAAPGLDSLAWAIVLLVAMIIEWSASLLIRHPLWQRSAWHFGLGLAALSYPVLATTVKPGAEGAGWLLLFNTPRSSWGLLWLITPALLTGLALRPAFSRSGLASWLSMIALLLAQLLTVGATNPFLVSSGIATILMLINTQRLQHLLVAAVTVGFGLACSSTIAWQLLRPWLDVPTWLALALWSLWLLFSGLVKRNDRLAQVYAAALNGWGVVLSSVNLSILTVSILLSYGGGSSPEQAIRAVILTTGAIAYRIWQRPSNLGFYGIAWGIELLIAGTARLTGSSLEGLAIANLALGLLTQLCGDWWTGIGSRIQRNRSTDPPIASTPSLPLPSWHTLSSWHIIPLLYALLGWLIAHRVLAAETGLYTLAAAVTGIGIGRRQPVLKPLIYIAIAGISIAAYELLIYQLLQASGEQLGDGVVLLAALATAIAVVYRLLSRWLQAYWRLTPAELGMIAHFHWAAGSGLGAIAVGASLSSTGDRIWLGVVAVLAAYALWQGRDRESWTYAGIVEALVAIAYWLYRTLPETVFVGWAAVIACLLALAMYTLPWARWGWSSRPWQQSAAVLPGVTVLLTAWGIALPGLLMAAAFYVWLARSESRTRLSYFGILLADWAGLRLFNDWGITEPLWYSAIFSSSLLYIAQVDPALRSPSDREKRHLLRGLATGIFCLTALYQSEASLLQGLLTIAFSIGLVLAGLALRIRAFLYGGTLTFMIKVLRLLWLFINNYSLLLWSLGIALGLVLIWIAATFEARRSQAIALVQQWVTELQAWE